MQSFQDLNKNKFENEDKIFKENEVQNQNKSRRKYACSKKMMLNRLKRNSRYSNVDNSTKFNVNELSNFDINESKKLFNKSYDLINDNKIDDIISDGSFYGDNSNINNTNYFDFKRESSFSSNQLPNINFNIRESTNSNFNYINNFSSTNKNNILKKNSLNKTENNTNKENNKSNITKDYEEVKKSENFLEFINYKIENYQKEMMEYLSKAKVELEAAYKKFYGKVIKISTDKARRISQVYTSDNKSGFLFNKTIIQTNNNTEFFHINNNNSILQNTVDQTNSTSNLNNYEDSNLNILKNNSSNFTNNNNLTNIFSQQNNFSYSKNKSENINLNTNNITGKSNTSFNLNSLHESPLMNKELENLKNFANKYITERIDTMFELHDNLKESIKQNIDLMKNFLNDYDFNCFNPMQEFINLNADEICNSWILPKVKFEKLNLNCILKNNKIPKIFRNYLINEDSENKFNKYTIERSVSYELDKRILKQNTLFLEKLIFDNFSDVNEIEKIFSNEDLEKLVFDKMKKLKFVNSNLDYLVNLNGFKNTNKLEAKNSFFVEIPTNFCVNFLNIKKINFRECQLSNLTVNTLMREFEKLNNLEEINFSKNDITLFNYRGYTSFKKLHTLILRKNKISKFYLRNQNLYPQLKIVDLSYNNIVELSQVKELLENNILVLISRNLGLYNNIEGYKEYLISLKSILSQIQNKLRKLDLSYLFYLFNHRDEFHLKNICLNKNLLFNIKKLNLSFNNLYDEDFTEFSKSNRGFVNIKEIILKNNRLTENFFEILIDLELNDLYEYLENIDLTNNNINHNCLESIFKAFQDNNNLKQISLKNNPIENYFYLFFCRRLENKQRYERFVNFFNNMEKLSLEKRNCWIILNYNSDLFKHFSNEAKEISCKFIKFEK